MSEEYVDPFMAELEAENAKREADNEAKLKASRERYREEAIARNKRQVEEAKKIKANRHTNPELAAEQDKATQDMAVFSETEKLRLKNKQAFVPRAGSSVVQNNPTNYQSLPAGVYQQKGTGKFFLANGRELTAKEASRLFVADAKARASAAIAAKEAAVEAEKSSLLSKAAIKKYAENVQALFINEIDQFSNFFANKEMGDEINIRKLSGDVPPGVFTDIISRRGQSGGSPLYGGFVHATPAQLASLQPLLRFFMVDQEGNEDEIYFSDYTTGEYAKKIADLRSGGTMNQYLAPRSQRGADAGIKSFRWNYNNKHEGDYIIEADLELYFGSLAELANINYLQFLFPTGADADLAKDINQTSKDISQRETRNASRTGNQVVNSALSKLKAKSKKYRTILAQGNNKLSSLGSGLTKDEKAVKKREFRQLKVIVGWSVPDGNRRMLKETFATQEDYLTFRRGVEATSRAIFLNLYDYNVDFQQEGPTTLSLKYLGSSDNYLATGGSDIFGSNNFKGNMKELMNKVTKTSVMGFRNYEGKVIDTSSAPAEDVSRAEANGSRGNLLAVADPYLNSVRTGRNSQGEPTLAVTLAGLKAAQDLALTELKIANLEKKDPEGKEISNIRQRGEYIVLMYERALALRLRDLYSQFLRTMISAQTVYKARVEVKNEAGAKVKIILNSQKVSERERQDQLRRVSQEARASVAPGAEQNMSLYDPKLVAETEDSSAVTVYYMRFGDILRGAMKNADLRDDITLVLGNVKNKSKFSYSLYDLPITLDTFGQFFYNRVVTNKLKSYPFRNFLDNMLGLVARTINQNPDVSERISFDYTVSSSKKKPQGLGFSLSPEALGSIGEGEMYPLESGGVKFHHYYNIFSRRSSHSNRKGNRTVDEAENIFHYVIGTDRGLAKNFNFSRQDTQFFQEMLIESNNAEDQIQALFLPQNVNITMFGNTLHKNGDLIFVDSRPSLGSFAGPVLGIGGYYRVIRSSHTIGNRGYETTLDCVFELRVIN
jgi:hypothetical protein